MSEGIRRRSLPPPGPLDEHGAALDARIRRKQDRGAPLDDEERAFLARLPAGREIPAEKIRDSAARHGGVAPLDAAKGLPHDAPPAGTRAEDREGARRDEPRA